jgi:photosystem II stability/assembly factor-like uncharacterized protein
VCGRKHDACGFITAPGADPRCRRWLSLESSTPIPPVLLNSRRQPNTIGLTLGLKEPTQSRLMRYVSLGNLSVGVISVLIYHSTSAHAQAWKATDASSGHIWSSIAGSADGSKLVAVSSDYQIEGSIPLGPIYLSTNSGGNWQIVTNAPLGEWICAVSSADASKFSAVDAASGRIYESLDAGAHWASVKTPSPYLNCLASSASGKILVTGAWDDFGHPSLIYVSHHYGTRWAKGQVRSHYWSGIACSANGKEMVAASLVPSAPGQIFRSADHGETWKPTSAPIDYWYHVTSSADGKILAATLPGKAIYVSTNSGATWTDTDHSNEIWQAVACSADGHEIVAVANGGFGGSIHISRNGGQTWTNAGAPYLRWSAVSVSADGNKIVAGTINSGIYTFQADDMLPSINYKTIRKSLAVSWIVPSSPAVLQRSSDGLIWTNVAQKPLLNLSTLRYEVVLPLTRDNFRLAPQ